MTLAAGLGPVKEGRALLPGDDRRPADILVPNWAGGRDAAMDVTVVTPLQAVTVAEAAITPGSALSFAYQRKVRKLQTAAAVGRALLFCLWWWSPWEAGTQPLRPK